MKAIQITIDEGLLARLDAEPEVKRLGRSAVFRHAVEAYLSRKKRRAITDAYRRAYRTPEKSPAGELEGWEDEGAWPER
jgi:metal-responsive CopG/Arc/MetJ family transcriptional regulator